MCGIMGYVGTGCSKQAETAVLSGLSRLEYRGYDSAGIGLSTPGGLQVVKKAGKLSCLTAKLEANPLPAAWAGIGHTRWATHGGANDRNAHPHFSSDRQICLVHNGIIENADSLRAALEASGSRFRSETDSEVAAELLAQEFRQDTKNTPEISAQVLAPTPVLSQVLVHHDQTDKPSELPRTGSCTPLSAVCLHPGSLDPTNSEPSEPGLALGPNAGALPTGAALSAAALSAGPVVSADSLSSAASSCATWCPDLERLRSLAARLARALQRSIAQLEGTFTLLAMHQEIPGLIVAARRSSPLVIGLGKDENFLGSDVLAFAQWTKRYLEIGQDQVALVTADQVVVLDAAGGRVTPGPQEIDFSTGQVSKGSWQTFMEKEIHEQPQAVQATLANRSDAQGYLTLDELRIEAEILRQITKVIIIACGTSSYAGQVARYAIEHWCRIPVEVELASEFRYRDPVVDQRTLVVAISQSGETMDTIMAIRHAREQGAKVLAIVNTPGSTISRASDAVLLTHAGREIAVASTKAFTAQIAACYLLGLYLAQVRGNKYIDEVQDYLQKLSQVPPKMTQVLQNSQQLIDLAKEIGPELRSVIFLGRHVGYPVAMEGALKLKELAYVHAEGFAAGELKHGPIALVDQGQPVFIVVPTARRPQLHQKVLANIQEVRARGAYTLVIAEEGDEKVKQYAEHIFWVPQTPTLYMPLLSIIPLQIFACQVAKAKGYDVDQPRNLAKSVTVE